MFSSEARPGSKTKQQIANQLELDPRQVSVWFQNRRARTKSKQTEHDYSVLKARYDSLASEFEALKRDNQCLVIELQRLKDLKEWPKDSTTDSTPGTCSSNGESVSLGSAQMDVARPEDYNHEKILNEAKTEGFKIGQEIDIQENINMIGSTDGSLASFSNHSSLEVTYLSEHNCVLDWWDFWT
ncbi:hypothetical protein BVRB_5g104030 [Beta vulgaris subsp. vulgaris]|nr:hypothetical protein BVRB_5g104030 [Beta vulgaris subsp. vulgaris]